MEALKGRSWEAAIEQGLQYIPTPANFAANGQQKQLEASLQAYAHGHLPTARTPKSFLLEAGNPVGSTTASITEVRYGSSPGAVEVFKSAKELRQDAYSCLEQLRDMTSVLKVEEQAGLLYRWRVITGMSDCPADMPSREHVPLCPELQEVAGIMRLYSGIRDRRKGCMQRLAPC